MEFQCREAPALYVQSVRPLMQTFLGVERCAFAALDESNHRMSLFAGDCKGSRICPAVTNSGRRKRKSAVLGRSKVQNDRVGASGWIESSASSTRTCASALGSGRFRKQPILGVEGDERSLRAGQIWTRSNARVAKRARKCPLRARAEPRAARLRRPQKSLRRSALQPSLSLDARRRFPLRMSGRGVGVVEWSVFRRRRSTFARSQGLPVYQRRHVSRRRHLRLRRYGGRLLPERIDRFTPNYRFVIFYWFL